MERKNFTNFDRIKVRLLQYIELQNIVKADFFEKSTIAASNFAGKGAESALSTTKIVQILTNFPDLNPDWLLLGKGKMLRSDEQKNTADNGAVEKMLKEIIEKKEQCIDALTRDNERLRLELDREKKKVASLSGAINTEPILR